MLQVNEVYYLRYNSEAHKYYNYLQQKLIEKLFTKVIKMASWMAWVQKSSGLIKAEGSARFFGEATSAEVENVSLGANIYNWSKLLSDIHSITNSLPCIIDEAFEIVKKSQNCTPRLFNNTATGICIVYFFKMLNKWW